VDDHVFINRPRGQVICAMDGRVSAAVRTRMTSRLVGRATECGRSRSTTARRSDPAQFDIDAVALDGRVRQLQDDDVKSRLRHSAAYRARRLRDCGGSGVACRCHGRGWRLATRAWPWLPGSGMHRSPCAAPALVGERQLVGWGWRALVCLATDRVRAPH